MSSKITLTVTQGKLAGKQYSFDSRSTCIIGRNHDCNLQLANEVDMTISRYHCLLDINPPDIRVRDLGSLNGTFVNGKKIGQRKRNQTAQEGLKSNFPEYDLQDGDEIKLGDIYFKIGIESEELQPEVIDKPILEIESPNYATIINDLLGLANDGDQNLQIISCYKLVRSLGKGNIGEVFLAENNKLRKLVAIKLMSPAVANKEQGINQFLAEANNTKFLSHTNIVDLLDYGFALKTFFFVMEYCEGGNIWDLMQRSGWRLPLNVAVDIIIQVLDGLNYAHKLEIPDIKSADGKVSKGFVHRNLNPYNILITYSNDRIIAKIGDYGLAKAFDLAGLSGQTLTGNQNQISIPAFIPRQQILDFQNSLPEVDVWATAACLYNMLTGYFPRNFTGDPWSAVLQNDPVPILKRNQTIPKKLAA
ncbi:MAG: FHA domain-containing protein, partial [Nostocales cyanobacterium]